jgi:hypothetical protein
MPVAGGLVGRNSTTMHKVRIGHFVDRMGQRRHASNVLSLARQVAAVTIVLAMTIGSPAVCGGWTAAADDRRACCVEETGCPMRGPSVHHSHAFPGTTQAQADACCAASESRKSSPTTPHFTNIASPSLVPIALPFVVAAPIPVDLSTRLTPVRRPGPVPRHLLLSVLIV